MKHEVTITVSTNKAVSNNTGISYPAKLVKKIFNGKPIDMCIIVDGHIDPRKIGKVKNIKITKIADDITVTGTMVTSLELNMSNKGLKLGLLYNKQNSDGKLDYKDIKRVFLYLIDNDLEDLLISAKQLCVGLHYPKGNDITNSHIKLDQIFN